MLQTPSFVALLGLFRCFTLITIIAGVFAVLPYRLATAGFVGNCRLFLARARNIPDKIEQIRGFGIGSAARERWLQIRRDSGTSPRAPYGYVLNGNIPVPLKIPMQGPDGKKLLTSGDWYDWFVRYHTLTGERAPFFNTPLTISGLLSDMAVERSKDPTFVIRSDVIPILTRTPKETSRLQSQADVFSTLHPEKRQQVAAAVAEALFAMGVDFEIRFFMNGREVELVVSPSNTAPLNRRARYVRDKAPGTLLVFDPRVDANGYLPPLEAWTPDIDPSVAKRGITGAITLQPDLLFDGAAGDVLEHEIGHARRILDLLDGKEDWFSGTIVYRSARTKDRSELRSEMPYSDRFSLSEIPEGLHTLAEKALIAREIVQRDQSIVHTYLERKGEAEGPYINLEPNPSPLSKTDLALQALLFDFLDPLMNVISVNGQSQQVIGAVLAENRADHATIVNRGALNWVHITFPPASKNKNIDLWLPIHTMSANSPEAIRSLTLNRLQHVLEISRKAYRLVTIADQLFDMAESATTPEVLRERLLSMYNLVSSMADPEHLPSPEEISKW